jgi:inosine-uridine nucleoside N-ribohydrolase
LAFALLSISILSYGLTGATYAQTDEVPLSVSSELPSYANGDTIVISGMIKTLAEYAQSITIVVVSPDGNIVTIAQVIPSTDGSYSTTVKAGGTMTVNGDYEIRAQYGAQKNY